MRAPPVIEVLEVVYNPDHGVLRTAGWLQDIEARFHILSGREEEKVEEKEEGI